MIDKFTEKLNIIESLPDQPTLNANELKRQFDLAGNLIKDFLNDILLPYVEKMESNMATKDDLKKFKEDIQKSLDDYIEELDNKFSKYKEGVQSLLDDINGKIENVIKYDSFVVDKYSHRANYNAGQTVTITGTQSKEGYYPVCVAGYYQEHDSLRVKGVYITSKTDGKVSYRAIVHNEDYGNGFGNILFEMYILWVKK